MSNNARSNPTYCHRAIKQARDALKEKFSSNRVRSRTRGTLYLIEMVALRAVDLEPCVVYSAWNVSKEENIFVRPLTEFLEKFEAVG